MKVGCQRLWTDITLQWNPQKNEHIWTHVAQVSQQLWSQKNKLTAYDCLNHTFSNDLSRWCWLPVAMGWFYTTGFWYHILQVIPGFYPEKGMGYDLRSPCFPSSCSSTTMKPQKIFERMCFENHIFQMIYHSGCGRILHYRVLKSYPPSYSGILPGKVHGIWSETPNVAQVSQCFSTTMNPRKIINCIWLFKPYFFKWFIMMNVGYQWLWADATLQGSEIISSK